MMVLLGVGKLSRANSSRATAPLMRHGRYRKAFQRALQRKIPWVLSRSFARKLKESAWDDLKETAEGEPKGMGDSHHSRSNS